MLSGIMWCEKSQVELSCVKLERQVRPTCAGLNFGLLHLKNNDGGFVPSTLVLLLSGLFSIVVDYTQVFELVIELIYLRLDLELIYLRV